VLGQKRGDPGGGIGGGEIDRVAHKFRLVHLVHLVHAMNHLFHLVN
jgi:hypothetical protein